MNKEEHLQKLLDEERESHWLVLAKEYENLSLKFKRKAEKAMANYKAYQNGNNKSR